MIDLGIYNQVAPLMEAAGIPEYIWAPIMELESSGNPFALADTPKEYSIGLFQINTKAHPEYAGYNLNDPRENALAIIDLWERRGVIEKARSLPIEEQAAYVWRYGSRPAWTPEKERRITELSKEYLSQKHNPVFDVDYNKITLPFETKGEVFTQYLEGLPDSPNFPQKNEVRKHVEEKIDSGYYDLGLTGIIARGIAYVLIVVIILVSLLQLFPKMPLPPQAEKIRKVVTK